MSTGLVVCSTCYKEVHQDGPVFDQVMTGERTRVWTHCVDKTRMCDNSTAIFPSSDSMIVGKYCERDRAPEDRKVHTVKHDGLPGETRQQRRARERKERQS